MLHNINRLNRWR